MTNLGNSTHDSSDSAEVTRSFAFLRSSGLAKLMGIAPSHAPTVLLHTVAWLLFGVFLASLQQVGFIVGKIGGSPALVVLVMSGPYAASAFAILYVPWLERYRARSLVAIPRVFAAASLLLAVACTGPVSLALVALFSLTLQNAGNVFYGRLLGQLYPLESRGRMLSLPMFVFAAAMAGMSAVAGKTLATSEAAYRWFLPAGAVIGVVAGALVLKFPVRKELEPPERSRLWDCVREVTRNRGFLLWTIVYSATSVGFWLYYAATPVYFKNILGLGYWENGVALAALNGTYCAGFLVWGRLLDRMRSLLTMAASWTLTGVGVLIMVHGMDFGSVIVGQCLAGLGLAGNDIAWVPVVLEFAPEDRVDRYMGFYMTIFGLRVLIGGAICGTLMHVAEMGSWYSLLLGSIVMLVGSTGMFLLRRQAAPRP